MTDTKVMKITERANRIDNFKSVTVFGDPGCDGLGAATMSIFAKALRAQRSDFSIIAGDIVHRGKQSLYDTVSTFVNSVALSPVYMLCGNHDTAFYNDYFGLRNYYLFNDHCLFVMLDNSSRAFSDEALEVLAVALKEQKRPNIVLFFHFPAPNSITTNTVSAGEWEKIERIIATCKESVRFFITGHVHSFIEEAIGNARLLVSGGGGARIEFMNNHVDPLKAHHHVLNLYLNSNGILDYTHISLDSVHAADEIDNKELRERLEFSLANEAIAHIRYQLFAVDAQEKGRPGLARLFRALSDSEMYHARNHLFVLDQIHSIEKNIQESIARERSEVENIYKEDVAFCDQHNFGLARYAFYDSLEAEKVHRSLLEKIADRMNSDNDIPLVMYHTCTCCGFTFASETAPGICPLCGAPPDRISVVE